MRSFVVAAAALGLLTASPAYAITGSGTVSFDFTQFTGPFASTDPANLANPAQWFLTGSVDGQIPTVNGHNTNAGFGQIYVGGTEALTGNSVDMIYTNLPGALNNNITFTPAASFNVADHTPFLLGTLSFTNGQWVGGVSGNPQANFPTTLNFTLSTHSNNQPAFNQTIHDSITMVVNQAANDIDCATNPQTQRDEADFVYITGARELGSMRVYDSFCAPAGVPNTGSVQLWAEFGSLDLLQFRNPTGGAFIVDSVNPGPIGGGVPEPAEWALLLTGFAASGFALRRRRAAPVHA